MMQDGWTPVERRAMLSKLRKFYEAYYYIEERRLSGSASTEKAVDAARRHMLTLEYNDIFTCREILRLLHESLKTQNVETKRNLLISVFNLMLVHRENDPRSWKLPELHDLWVRVMRADEEVDVA